MHRSTRLLVPCLVAVAAVGATTLGAQVERKTLSGSSVAVYNIAGRMTVESGSGSDVIVEVTRRGSDGAKLSIETGETRGANALRVVYPGDDIVYPDTRWRGNSSLTVNRDGSWGENEWANGRRVRVRSSGSGLEAWADIRVLVPAGKKIDLHLGVGELSATNVNGSVRLETAAGHITASGSRGDLTLDAGSGGIDVRDMSGGELRLDTGSGGASLSGITATRCAVDAGSGGVTASDIACDELKMDVGSGSARIDRVKSSTVKIDAGSGGVRLGLTTLPKDVKIETGSGGVTLSIPANSGASVEIETGSGSIETDFPVTSTRMDRNRLRGTIGNGNARIRIDAGSGGVRLIKN
jgi:hypothetical protein